MASQLEINKESAEKLYDLLMIRNENGGVINKRLDESIARTKASMTKEAIAWVEAQIDVVK
jgi:hypothetical protein